MYSDQAAVFCLDSLYLLLEIMHQSGKKDGNEYLDLSTKRMSKQELNNRLEKIIIDKGECPNENTCTGKQRK